MRKTMFVGAAVLAFALGGAAGAYADAPSPVARSIFNPAAPSQATRVKAKIAKRKSAPASSRLVLYAKGSIVSIRPADRAKKLSERILLAVGKKRVEIAVEPGTVVVSARGRIVAISSLRKGEKVDVTYTGRGTRDRADRITILS